MQRRTRLLAPFAAAAVIALATHEPGAAAQPPTPAGAPEAPADCAEAVAARVQARYDAIRDLEARFEQTTRAVVLGQAESAPSDVSRGHVVFAKPGRMRWTYEEPRASRVISDGATLWIHDVEAREAQRMPVTAGMLSGAALQFLFGEGDLLGEFRVSASGCGDDEVALDLVPRREAGFERFGLRVDAKTGDILETSVVDILGNVTVVKLTQVRFDRDPAAETFRFEAGPGVEVIDLATGT